MRLPSKDMPGGQFLLFNAVVVAGHILVLLNTGAYLPMIPEVGARFGVNTLYANWAQTDFFVGLALSGPLSVWLVSRRGEAQLFFEVFAGFAAAAAVCVVAGSFPVFLVARFFMGLIGGLSIPLSLSVLIRHYQLRRRGVGLALWGTAALTPFSVAPLIGGWITDTVGWRALFITDVIASLVIGVYGFLLLQNRDRRAVPMTLDAVGLVLLGGTLVAAQVTLDVWEVNYGAVNAAAAALAILTVALAAVFLVWEWHTPYPLVELRLLLRRNFAIGAGGIFCGMLFLQGLVALYIVQGQVTFGYTALLTGVLMLPMLVFSKPVAGIMHIMVRRADPRLLAAGTFLGFAAFAFWVSSYDREATYTTLLWPQLAAGAFIGALFPATTVIALSGLSGPAELRAVGLFNMIRVAGQGYGIPIVATLYLRWGYVHRQYLVQGDSENHRMFDHAVQALGGRLAPAGAHHAVAAGISRHAALLTFNELFYVSAGVFLVLGCLMLLAAPVRLAEPDLLREKAIEELAEP